MKLVRLNGKACISQEDLHEQLKATLHLPDHYGKNLDALWDCLTGEIELPVQLIWEDFLVSKEYLGEYADTLQKLFKEAEMELRGQFQFTIQ
ncbi:barstar family protein [Bacillus sp. Bos-x628]|uniref:barstar family protein n=1 Tax=Bacillus maqinnsis TaxID=3229854 RepID=UPI00338D50BF